MHMEAEEELELRFQRAAARMRSNSSLRLGNDQKLQLYGYFKQVIPILIEHKHEVVEFVVSLCVG